MKTIAIFIFVSFSFLSCTDPSKDIIGHWVADNGAHYVVSKGGGEGVEGYEVKVWNDLMKGRPIECNEITGSYDFGLECYVQPGEVVKAKFEFGLFDSDEIEMHWELKSGESVRAKWKRK